ncbi:hypothetical protein [Sphingomonas sp. CFBP 8760]|uniref:hypothetical protein n=1 Tax=Sphingomonas sp. CFBP 8760 TaxID=2775282 RepID=UPI0017870264|nr:hypothetical protein [Sphingomonas sp. CFBP 8760]MBD8548173.1 hypothetical protein [Sphingomonas sp. CFBP 8760]
MRTIVVFVMSLAAALLFLGIERFAGIPWNFHPDSVTYATFAHDTVRAILAQSYFLILNNGYYFWADLLGMSVALMTAANMLLFASTNVILFRFHDRYCNNDRGSVRWLIALLLILANPYRLHLATTALKDTMIVMFVVLMAVNGRRAVPWFAPFLGILRVASIFYLIIKLPRKHLIRLLFVALLLSLVFADALGGRLLEFNSADMQLREFDRIPNFRNLGLFGTLARGVFWPILAMTGAFAVLSPALAFIPVAIGSVMNQIYCRMATGRFAVPLAILVPMAIIGALVTGYTAYIRYVYPLLVVLPIVAIQQRYTEEVDRLRQAGIAPAFAA